MQGLFRNYTEFLGELAQTGMSVLAQSAGSLMPRAGEAPGASLPPGGPRRISA